MRPAIGASGAGILAGVLAEGAGFAAVGSPAGGGLWLSARSVLRMFLPGSAGMEPVALLFGAVGLTVVAGAAGILPFTEAGMPGAGALSAAVITACTFRRVVADPADTLAGPVTGLLSPQPPER